MLFWDKRDEDLREVDERHEKGKGDHEQEQDLLVSSKLADVWQKIVEIDDALLRAWLELAVAGHLQGRDHRLLVVDESFVGVGAAGLRLESITRCVFRLRGHFFLFFLHFFQ